LHRVLRQIAEAEDADGNNPNDIDSTPDTDPNDDTLVFDNDTDSTFGDDDDHDPAVVLIGVKVRLMLTM